MSGYIGNRKHSSSDHWLYWAIYDPKNRENKISSRFQTSESEEEKALNRCLREESFTESLSADKEQSNCDEYEISSSSESDEEGLDCEVDSDDCIDFEDVENYKEHQYYIEQIQ